MINLNKQLFWDADYKKLDYKKNANFIIGRVLAYGDIEDWKAIKTRYGLRKIKSTAKNTCFSDKKSLNFWSIIFNVPKSSFKCAKRLSQKKQSPFFCR